MNDILLLVLFVKEKIGSTIRSPLGHCPYIVNTKFTLIYSESENLYSNSKSQSYEIKICMREEDGSRPMCQMPGTGQSCRLKSNRILP